MCLILLAYQAAPRYPLIVAANRDESYARPTAPASFWRDAPHVLAGRDLLQGGTWLGVTRSGRLAALTNLREEGAPPGDCPSRGELVRDFLLNGDHPERYLESVRSRARRYSGFQLIVGDRSGLYLYGNCGDGGFPISPGIYGFSNHSVDAPWPKTVRGRNSLAQAVGGGNLSEEDLLAILADSTPPCADQHPEGRGEGETPLSPIFMRGAAFGTRCSTVILLDEDGVLTFAERTFSGGGPPSTVRVRFAVS